MSVSPFSNAPILLWGSLDSLHCTLRRCAFGPPFEISILSGGHRIKRLAFEHHQAASDFAIAEMRVVGETVCIAIPALSPEPSDPSDPSAS